MENLVDIIDEKMNECEEYKNLGLDQRGEFCVELAKLINNYFGG